MLGYQPPRADPPPPPGADSPLGADIPLGADPLGAETPLGADTPLRADTPGADTPWEQTSPGSRHPPGSRSPQEQTPPPEHIPSGAVHAGRYGQQAGGTHPTGMHSCFIFFYKRNLWCVPWDSVAPPLLQPFQSRHSSCADSQVTCADLIENIFLLPFSINCTGQSASWTLEGHLKQLQESLGQEPIR